MRDTTKRELREQKREIKRAGVQRVRRLLKQGLVENPEEVHATEFDFGRYSTVELNGLDRDANRRGVAAQPQNEDP